MTTPAPRWTSSCAYRTSREHPSRQPPLEAPTTAPGERRTSPITGSATQPPRCRQAPTAASSTSPPTRRASSMPISAAPVPWSIRYQRDPGWPRARPPRSSAIRTPPSATPWRRPAPRLGQRPRDLRDRRSGGRSRHLVDQGSWSIRQDCERRAWWRRHRPGSGSRDQAKVSRAYAVRPWSPDGRRVVFAAGSGEDRRREPLGHLRLMTGRTTPSPTSITPRAPPRRRDPRWGCSTLPARATNTCWSKPRRRWCPATGMAAGTSIGCVRGGWRRDAAGQLARRRLWGSPPTTAARWRPSGRPARCRRTPPASPSDCGHRPRSGHRRRQRPPGHLLETLSLAGALRSGLAPRRPPAGTANGWSMAPILDPAGRTVFFLSQATDLVRGFADGNGIGWDLYRWDEPASSWYPCRRLEHPGRQCGLELRHSAHRRAPLPPPPWLRPSTTRPATWSPAPRTRTARATSSCGTARPGSAPWSATASAIRW